MKSPFPGMDPYLEGCGLWEDFHPKLISEIERSLAALVPDRYLVQLGQRSYVVLAEEEEGKEKHLFKPDVGITAPPGVAARVAVTEPATDTEAVTIQAFVATEMRETFVEVLDADQRLVTCIEVLSPSNKDKGSKGWKKYLRKRQALMLGEASLVEIDLLRGGARLPMLQPWPASPYTLLVCRDTKGPLCRVWPAHFRRRLPAIPVPLQSPDPDVMLDLQPLLEAVYERSRYHRRIDYTKPLDPPLAAEDAAWLAEALRASQG